MCRIETVLFLGLCCLASSLPTDGNEAKAHNFIGEATSDLSTAILQGYIDGASNFVFSPLGYSAILAILAEGAKGESRKQLESALHLPEDKNLIRSKYNVILDELKTDDGKNGPQFMNWFYIYKNYTVRDEYKKILQEFYLTDVKNVERYEAEFKLPEETAKTAPESENSKDVVQFEMIKKEENKDVSIDHKSQNEPSLPEKIQLPLGDENAETIDTVERKESKKIPKKVARNLIGNYDIASSLSGNGIARKNSTDKESMMIVFNGLYYRGTWVTPFERVTKRVEMFYRSEVDKKPVAMMETSGLFKIADLNDLDSVAIELPYQGGRYALLLVVPRTRGGLRQLTADLTGISLGALGRRLQPQLVRVTIPVFQVETTSKPSATFAKIGVSDIFGQSADLSGISDADGLYVQELVQHVTVKVDEGGSSENFLTASNAKSDLLRTFTADRPFLFFVRDTIHDLVVVAGKLTDPKSPEDSDFEFK